MITHKDGTLPTYPAIFVFGSNLAGRHGAGAAKVAYNRFGAIYGVGQGHTGNAYAIPTKDQNLRTLSLDVIQNEIHVFLEYANNHNDSRFFITRIGCGLAGFRDNDIAPRFICASENCDFPEEWSVFLK